MIKQLKIISNIMGRAKRYYLFALIAIIFSTLFAYSIPLVVRFVIDSVIGLKAPSELFTKFFNNIDKPFMQRYLWFFGIIIVFFSILEGFFSFLKGKWASITSEKFAKNLRMKLYDHINNIAFSEYSSLQTGDLIQRTSSDIETIRLFIETQSIEVIRLLIMIIIVLPIMFSINLKMTLISTLIIPVIIVFSISFFIRAKQYFKDVAESEATFSTIIQESLSGIRLTKAFCRQEHEISRFNIYNIDYRDKTMKMISAITIYWSTSALLCMLQISAVLLIGIIMTTRDELSIGDLTAFLSYVTTLVWPIRGLGRILGEMSRAMVSVDRVKYIMDIPIEKDVPPNISSKSLEKMEITGDIEFVNLNFTYPNSTSAILHDISFKVKKGMTVAVIGPTGSGKSSFIQLLPRLFDYTKGSILIDGVELKNIPRKLIRKNIGIVLQEPFLFSKSLKDNIKIASDNEISDEMLYKAAQIADIHHTIVNDFKDAYDTIIGEKGVTLSGGQQQRIAIARAIIKEPPILILDDSLSAVDAQTDAKIREAIKSRNGIKTTFIISHRISTISQADMIIILENGRITQQGTHDELKKQSGLYSRICDIQNMLKKELKTTVCHE